MTTLRLTTTDGVVAGVTMTGVVDGVTITGGVDGVIGTGLGVGVGVVGGRVLGELFAMVSEASGAPASLHVSS